MTDTLPALLRRNRVRHGEERVIVTDDRHLTHRQLDDESGALAARLVAAGCGKSARVGLLAPNGIDWVVTAAAAMRIGAVLVPLSTLLRPPELLAQLRIAAVTHLIVAEGFRGRRYLDDIEAAAPGLLAACREGRRHAAAPSVRAVWRLVRDAGPDDRSSGSGSRRRGGRGDGPVEDVGGVPRASVAPDLVDALGDQVRPADDLVVLFTSGSRGLPKGVVHTHGGALRATGAGLDARCVARGEVLYIPMPFFWTGGFASGLLTVLVAGAALLTEAEPQPERTLALLERERATLFRGWPDQAVRLAGHPAFASADLSSLGDGSLPAVLPPERRPKPGARANVFGMTETFGPYCGHRMDRDLPDPARGSCGKPFEGVEVRIVDPDTGRTLDAGAQGEIWLRGPNLLRGVCGRPAAEVFTADGFYPTGDLGRLDDGGYLFFDGRLDDMFKVSGATVYPSEVEAALRSVAEVRQAYVTDVTVGDDRREVGALVITDAPVADVAAAVRERLSSFKVPTRWVVRPDQADVPLMATGKVDKPALQRLIARQGDVARRTS